MPMLIMISRRGLYTYIIQQKKYYLLYIAFDTSTALDKICNL
jgi:hypothetical protein